MALAEIPEAAATGAVAALYDRLRAAQGMPLINLIWRHMATLPGVLDWAVAAVEPVLRSAALAEARARVGAAAVREFGALAPIGPAPEGVAAVLEAYDRGNGGNLILLTALRGVIAEGAAASPVVLPAGAVAPIGPLPPIARLEALPAETAALVRRLAARHGLAGGIIPSLYLHLVPWPGLLAALEPALAPAFASGAVVRARDAAVAQAVREAAALRPALAPPGEFPAEHRQAVLAVLAQFTTEVIPAMVPVGAAIKAGLG